MSGRTIVVIFFFWAALTIITPTLVLWSESSKPSLELNGQRSEGIRDRKMIGHGVKQVSKETISSTQLEAAATTEHPNWSWLQEFESCVNKVFRKAMGLLIRVLSCESGLVAVDKLKMENCVELVKETRLKLNERFYVRQVQSWQVAACPLNIAEFNFSS